MTRLPTAAMLAVAAGVPGVLAALPMAGCSDQSSPADVSTPGADDPAATTMAGESSSVWFHERAASRGLAFHHESGHRERYYMPEAASAGAALIDIDGDGDLDAYLIQSGDLEKPPEARPGNRMFRNDGRGFFEDVTEWSGTGDRRYGMGAATGDYDNDGDVDLYVCNAGRNTLYRNDGNGRFTDVTDHAGVGHEGLGTSAAFVDYDADGDLDLIVLNYLYWSTDTEIECRNTLGEPDYCMPAAYGAPAEDVLYRNDGDGRFTDVTAEAGIDAALGTGLGIVCGEFSGDDLVDVYVANDGMRNLLWVNQGDGTFKEQAMYMGCGLDQEGLAKAGMGVAAADVDHDGDEDLLVVNLVNESDSFYRNVGGYFVDDTALVGLAAASRPFTRFGLGMVDLDGDGFIDVFEACGRVAREARVFGDDPYAEPDIVLRGTPDGRFEQPPRRSGTSEPLVASSRAAAFGDIDNDGDLDILIGNRDAPPHLLINVKGQQRSWSMLRVLDAHGRDALGARVRLTAGGRQMLRVVRTAYSYCAANDPRVHFGLGEVESIDALEVTWPDGTVERFDPPPVRTIATLRRAHRR